MPKGLDKLIKNTEPENLVQTYVNENNYARATQDGVDLLSRILVYDKFDRITAKQALQHAFFDPIRALEREADEEVSDATRGEDEEGTN